MNKSEFEAAISTFDVKRHKNIIEPAEALRRDFVKRFSPARIRNLRIDEYAEGKGIKENNFCYELEWKLGALGKIVGASCSKFGIFYKKKINDYYITKAWRQGSLSSSFKYLRTELADLIEAGKTEMWDIIRASNFSPMFKGKILATYYPDTYLNIFSEEHLDFFIHSLDLDLKVKKGMDEFDKRNILVEFKNSVSEMSSWPLNAFSHFLYTVYPGKPQPSEKNPSEGKEEFEFFEGAEMIDGDFLSLSDDEEPASSGKGDYERQNKKRKELGDRGEYVVMQYEIENLRKNGIRKKPKHVALEDDALGYDILSYSADGSKKYLEVKATNSNPKDFNFFLSANELTSAFKYGQAFHLYIVFKPHSARPKIFDIGNPFIEDGKVKLMPVNYRIHLQKQ